MSRSFQFYGNVDDDLGHSGQTDERDTTRLRPTHTRFPSPTAVAGPPSVDNSLHYSSHPSGSRDSESEVTQLDLKISTGHLPIQDETHEQIFYRGGHDDDHDDPEDSDFDDDAVSASVSLDSSNETETETGDDDSTCRISLQGPKIRFHSRAPWETDDICEGDGPDRPTIFGAKLKSKASRPDIVRTLGLGTIMNRPSVDSSRSLTASKVSMDISRSSHRPLRSLSQEPDSSRSVSGASPLTTSLSTVSREASDLRGGDGQPSSDHSDPKKGSSYAILHQGIVRPSTSHHDNQILPPSPGGVSTTSRSGTPSSFISSQGCPYPADIAHPYANPDLVVPYSKETSTTLQQTTSSGVTRNDSFATVPDTVLGKFSPVSRVVSNNSITSKDIQSGHRILKERISSPTAVIHGSDAYLDRNTKFLSLRPPPHGYTGLNGWGARPQSPTVALISLQEAQARERSRSATSHSAVHSENVDSAPLVPFPLPEVTSISESSNDSSSSGTPRVRARSVSAGARARNALHSVVGSTPPQPERKDSGSFGEPSGVGRGLKHKKSGFMRLFTGRGDGDRTPPPPVPPRSDACLVKDPQTTTLVKSSMLPLSRVSTLTSASGASEEEEKLVLGSKGRTTTRKCLPPPLHIHTGKPNSLPPFPTSGLDIPSGTLAENSRSVSSSALTMPQSAPPAAPDFQGLRLRPASALFSTHFADFVANSDDDIPSDSATSPTVDSRVVLSPLTPTSSRPSGEEPHIIGDHSSTIKALQDQMLSAKKAWQQQVWELQGQVRDLKAELEDLRTADNKKYCDVCRRGDPQKWPKEIELQKKLSIVDRPRARTCDNLRFSSGAST
ncbi:hypothetical protein ID866_2970 [Astraeus odoratus]|nr:hypothetical protein ID866_2970 [Astraeus odoratus]